MTAKIDGAAFTSALTSTFNLITIQECEPATWTTPTAQTTPDVYYIGRASVFTFPAWTMSPTHCTVYSYYFDNTASGVLGAAYDQFTVNFGKDARTITIASSSTWESGEKKTYTIPITIKWGSGSTLLAPAKTYNY